MKKRILTKLALLFSLFLFISINGFTQSNKYYVSSTGSNSNNGQTGTPFLTIGQAITTAANGDTIVVNPGTYRETIDLAGKNVVITSTFMFNQDTNLIATTKLDLQEAGVNGEFILLSITTISKSFMVSLFIMLLRLRSMV